MRVLCKWILPLPEVQIPLPACQTTAETRGWEAKYNALHQASNLYHSHDCEWCPVVWVPPWLVSKKSLINQLFVQCSNIPAILSIEHTCFMKAFVTGCWISMISFLFRQNIFLKGEYVLLLLFDLSTGDSHKAGGKLCTHSNHCTTRFSPPSPEQWCTSPNSAVSNICHHANTALQQTAQVNCSVFLFALFLNILKLIFWENVHKNVRPLWSLLILSGWLLNRDVTNVRGAANQQRKDWKKKKEWLSIF